jgi:cysteine synthase
MRGSRELAPKEGIFIGIAAGAMFAGALQVCRDSPKAPTCRSSPMICCRPSTITDARGTRSPHWPTFRGMHR